MALSADLLRGYTDTIILNQLSRADSYGYEINKRISELSRGALELKEATLYTAFRRLEEAGHVTSYWGDERTGARRRYYRITEAGRLRLLAVCLAFGLSRLCLALMSDYVAGMGVVLDIGRVYLPELAILLGIFVISILPTAVCTWRLSRQDGIRG